MDYVEEMEAEYEAWGYVIRDYNELRAGTGTTSTDRLCASMCFWAENLVYLRMKQTPEARDRAFGDARGRYYQTHRTN